MIEPLPETEEDQSIRDGGRKMEGAGGREVQSELELLNHHVMDSSVATA